MEKDPGLTASIKAVPERMALELVRYSKGECGKYDQDRLVDWYTMYRSRWTKYFLLPKNEYSFTWECQFMLFQKRNDNNLTRELCTKLFRVLFHSSQWSSLIAEDNDTYFFIVAMCMGTEICEMDVVELFVRNRNAVALNYFFNEWNKGKLSLFVIKSILRDLDETHPCKPILETFCDKNSKDPVWYTRKDPPPNIDPLLKIRHDCNLYNVVY